MAPVDVHSARRVAGAITGGALVVAALAVVRTLFYGAVATASGRPPHAQRHRLPGGVV